MNITVTNSSTTVDTALSHSNRTKAFKRFRIGKELDEIDKWLDSKEINLEELRTSSVGHPDPFSDE
jgi:hypothetical protein